MKRISHQIIRLICALMLFVLAGCGVSEGSGADVEAPDKDAVDEYPAYDENLVFTYYSDDESVYLRQDYNTDKSFIVDGNLEIPVDISMGGYAPMISKTDIDGDGQDE